MKILYLMTLIFLPGLANLHAQNLNFVLSYPVSFSVGDLEDYISKPSFRGISMEVNLRRYTDIDVGLETGWNTFYQKTDEKVYTDKTVSISGVQFRYTNCAPILAGIKIYQETAFESFKPYFGLGVGTLYIERTTDFGLYRIITDTWQFCMRPEAGFKFDINEISSFLLVLKYYAGFANDDLKAQAYASVNVGLMLGF